MSVSSLPPALTPTFARERPQDGARVQDLIDHTFGPGRYAKSAERLREGNEPDLELSLVAWSDDRAVGCVRLWPILVGQTRALLLGPFAVEDAWRSRGLGAELVDRACQAARAQGHDLVLLVGDESYFDRFGFKAVPAGQVVLPGPAAPNRTLWLSLKGEGTPTASGLVVAPPKG